MGVGFLYAGTWLGCWDGVAVNGLIGCQYNDYWYTYGSWYNLLMICLYIHERRNEFMLLVVPTCFTR